MRNCFKLFGIIALAALIGFSMTACDNDDGGGGSSGGGLEGTWSQPNGAAIRFNNGNLQSTSDITANNVNWTAEGIYTFSSPTLTITPPAQGGVVQNAITGTAVISGIQLTLGGFPDALGINGSWSRQ